MADNGGWSYGDRPNAPDDPLAPLKEMLAPLKGRGSLIIKLGLVVVAVLLVSSAFFQLEPEEEAIVLRVGKPLPETFTAGLHTRIPLADQVYKAPVHRQHRLEFGFRSQPGVVTKVDQRGYAYESLMLTGDLMLVHVRWSLVYKIEDIHAWLFKIKDREQTIRDISMAVMRQIVGDYSLEEVLTTAQLELATLGQTATQDALREKVPTGVLITEVAIKTSEVPEAARQAFDDLTRTLAKVQGELADSKAEQDNAIGVARRQKSETIGRAEKELSQVIENARGEAGAFLAKATEHDRAPEITRQWMYFKSMQQVLRSLDEKLVIEDRGKSGITKHLPLKDFMTGALGGSK